jgi:hypothetical protein
MDRGKLQLALMARGIRIAEDDPLLILLELNEIHFDELAAKHLQSLDQHKIVEIVLQIVKRIDERHPQQQSRCVGGVLVERTATRLESVAATFGQLEGRMADVARISAIESSRIVASKVLTQLSKEVSATLLRFEQFGDQTANISEAATRMINASRHIHSDASKKLRRTSLYAVIAILIFGAGVTLGNLLVSNTLSKVQAACAMQTTQ